MYPKVSNPDLKQTPMATMPSFQPSTSLRYLMSIQPLKPTSHHLEVGRGGGGALTGSIHENYRKLGRKKVLVSRRKSCWKSCGGCVSVCEVNNKNPPLSIFATKVTKVSKKSNKNYQVDILYTLNTSEILGMNLMENVGQYMKIAGESPNWEVIVDRMLRRDYNKRKKLGASPPSVVTVNEYGGNLRGAGEKRTAEVDAVVGADGANSRVAKSIGAGEYEYAIAFQERVKIPESKMEYYKERAEMYVGDDVSPDFYGWVFPKCDHVAVGTGTVTHKTDIKKFQAATRLRAKDKIEGGTIIRVEAHPIPEHPRPRRVLGRVALVGDAAGYVTKCSGEGIYFAAKSGRMCAEAIVEGSENGSRMIEESDLRKYLAKFDKMYWPTYKVLDVLQKVFYRSNAAREAFVEMCADEYVQKMTFDSYLYKKVVPGNPLDDLKLAVNTIGSLVRANALRREMDKITL
ncbi:hypothetical protein ZIOFF_003201 [Zingiber officinale]|uniref:Geranylgeranyl diphosphate reductase, chloroplastic n=1 Tax=Zingiber officinale TaxID=94328 RepID=A0A8J5LWH8_ZINOF|nr:hypothetical protein ZIOFF_003201 [Zingiber officinale]